MIIAGNDLHAHTDVNFDSASMRPAMIIAGNPASGERLERALIRLQ